MAAGTSEADTGSETPSTGSDLPVVEEAAEHEEASESIDSGRRESPDCRSEGKTEGECPHSPIGVSTAVSRQLRSSTSLSADCLKASKKRLPEPPGPRTARAWSGSRHEEEEGRREARSLRWA